jgi:LPXTG-motif cell wall-anchored protein
MLNFKKTILAALAFIGITSFGVQAKASSIPFQVAPQYPSNQIDKNAGYFYMKMTPGQTEEIGVNLFNSSNSSMTIDIEKAVAKTALSGMVTYMPMDNVATDASMKYNMADQMQITPTKVDLPPLSMKAVTIKVTMPNVTFDGVLAGGLTFKQEGQPTSTKVKGQMNVVNNYQYVTPVVIRQNMTILPPKVELTKVEASQLDERNIINFDLRNPVAAYVNQLAIDTKVTGADKNTKKISYSTSQANMQMAPNSTRAYPLRMNGQPFIAGKYQAKMTVYGDQDPTGTYNYQGHTYKYRWQLTRDFNISPTQAKKYNTSDQSVKLPTTDNTWLYWLIGGLLALLIVLAVAFFIFYKKQKNKEN